MGIKFSNNASAQLASSINNSTTTIVVQSGQGNQFPTLGAGDYFYATLVDILNNLEIVKVTARSGDTLTVVRGQDSTTGKSFSAGDIIELRPTAAAMTDLANSGSGGPAFSAWASAQQTLSSGVGAKVACDTERFDTDNCYDNTTYRFTPNKAGYYQINATVKFQNTQTDYLVYLVKSGAGYVQLAQFQPSPAQLLSNVSGTTLMYMNGTTDYVELYVRISGGSGFNINSTVESVTSQFSGCFIRA